MEAKTGRPRAESMSPQFLDCEAQNIKEYTEVLHPSRDGLADGSVGRRDGLISKNLISRDSQ